MKSAIPTQPQKETIAKRSQETARQVPEEKTANPTQRGPEENDAAGTPDDEEK